MTSRELQTTSKLAVDILRSAFSDASGNESAEAAQLRREERIVLRLVPSSLEEVESQLVGLLPYLQVMKVLHGSAFFGLAM